MFGWLKIDYPLRKLFAESWPEAAKLPTRPEEFTLATEMLQHCSHILDAGTGYIPEYHILPYMLAKRGHVLVSKRRVVAMDHNKDHLKMPEHKLVKRMMGDILDLPFEDREFDGVACISVLEHLPNKDVEAAIKELARVCDGVIVLTMDNREPRVFADILSRCGIDPGQPTYLPGHNMTPIVSFVVGHR